MQGIAGSLPEAELSEILLDADPLATLSLAEPSTLLEGADCDGLPGGSDSDGADALGTDSLGALAEPLGALSDGADSLGTDSLGDPLGLPDSLALADV